MALAAIFLVVPAVLVWIAGWPSHLPTYASVTRTLQSTAPDELVVRVIVIILWIYWTILSLSIVAELVVAVRGVGVPLHIGPRVNQRIARQLATSVVLLAATAHPTERAIPASPPMVAAVATTTIPDTHHTSTPPARAATAPAKSDPASQRGADHADAPLRLYRVQQPRGRHHDTLWDIARRHLGDPLRFEEIADLNRGRPQPDGGALTEPGLIQPGWELLMPADATGLPVAEPVTAKGSAPQGTWLAHGDGSAQRDDDVVPPSRPTPHPATPPAATVTPPVGSDAAVAENERAVTLTVALPSGSVVAASFLAGVAAATAARRLRRRRRYHPAPPAPAALNTAPPPPTALQLATSEAAPAPAGDVETGGSAFAHLVLPWLYEGLSNRTPGVVAVAHRDDTPIAVDLVAVGPVTIEAPEPFDTARAILATFLTRSWPFGAKVLMPADVYDRLLPGVIPFDGLRRTVDLDTALDEVETELVARARLLEQEDEPDFTEHRAHHPEEPLTAVLVVTDDVTSAPDRLTAVLRAGRRLGITALHLQPMADAGVITADASNTITAATGELPTDLVGAQLYRLTTQDAADALGALAAAVEDPADDGRPEPAVAHDALDEAAPPDDAAAEVVAAADEPAAGVRVAAQLLGGYSILVDGEPVRSGLLRSSRELLAYLVVHPVAATPDQLVEAIEPDTRRTQVSTVFWNAFGSLRRRLREVASDLQLDAVTYEGGLLRVNRAALTADLWEFQRALADARAANDDDTKRAALSRAVELYQGDLLAGLTYEWAEPAREQVRRVALDALAHLAELAATAGREDEAVTALERAIAVDPFAEEMYRRLMRLHFERGRFDAASRIYRQCRKALADIDADPDDETEALAGLCAEAETEATRVAHARAGRSAQPRGRSTG
jgi:DNA-binding SARP family transcriptional activator